MEIIRKKEEPLLERTEIMAESEGMLTRETAQQAIASSLKIDKKLVTIRKITPIFGTPRVKILAHAYKKEEKLKEVEPATLLNKNSKRKAAHEKAAGAAKAEATENKEEAAE